MSIGKLLFAVGASALIVAPAGFGQTSAPAPTTTTTATAPAPANDAPKYIRAETAEQRRQRLGTTEDPGSDPDPKKNYWRFGQLFHVEKYERKWAAYDVDQGFVRPFAFANVAFEIYQQNDNYVWVWVPENVSHPPQPQAQPEAPAERYDDATYAFLKRVRPEFSELAMPVSGKTVHFKESSQGLPSSGSWRVSAAVADMNGDGCPDIIAPPERKGNGMPAIFLGDCKGNWKYWAEARFPRQLDYGSVVAADFNKDGKMDLAFAVHLNGLFVLLGDGKGNFTEALDGLPHDFPTRRLIVADVDHDGYPDLVALSEGPTQIAINPNYGLIRAYLNRKKGTLWEAVNVATPDVKVGGDWMSAGNFNGDAYPDFVVSSNYYGTMNVVYLSAGPKKWKPVASDGDLVPSQSYYFASATGKFTSKDHDDAIITYDRFWPQEVNAKRVAPPELLDVMNVDLLRFSKGSVTRKSLARWKGRLILGVGVGDFDHDGNLDVILLRDKPRDLVILLGDGHGGFTSAAVEGIPLQSNPIYDVKVADVNGDGRPDVILMYESAGRTTFGPRDGGIHVFLNVGTDAGKPASVAKK